MKNMSARQLMIFYCISSVSLKFLSLPSLLAQTAHRDAWIAAGVGTLIELAVLYIALTVIVKNKTAPIVKLIAAPAMLFIFLIQIFILMNQSFDLLNDNLFENFSVHYFAIPILVLGVFFCFMPPRAIFRSGEIFFIFIIIGVILSVFPALARINADEVLPIFERGVVPSFNTAYRNLIYFESAFMLLIFTGEVKVEKHFRKKFMGLAVGLGVFFVFFVFMFYSLFGSLAPAKNIAVTSMTLYSSYSTGNGRFDWVLITMWLLLLLLRFGITFFCAFRCLCCRAKLPSIGLGVFVWALTVFVFTTTRELDRFIGAIPWLIVILYVAVPLMYLFARRRDV
jgi:spore germination protein KB